MSFKREVPARPPPPKVVGKKTDSTPAMKFSFKSLEEDEDDEEDLTIMTGELTKKVESDKLKIDNKLPDSPNKISTEKKSHEESDKPSEDKKKFTKKEVGEARKVVASQRSWDSPTHVSTSTKAEPIPIRSSSADKLQKYSKSVEEEGSAMSWLKQNVAEISSAVKDKAERARKKIGELSENIGKDEDEKVKVKEMKTLNTDTCKTNESMVESQHVVKRETVEQLKSTPVDKVQEEHTDVVEENLPSDAENEAEEVEEFNIVDDFYSNEPAEDFTGVPSVTSTNTFEKKKPKTSLKRRLVKGKVPKLTSPVAMSKLSKDKVDELEEATFFNAADETVTVTSKSKHVTDPSKLQTLAETVEKHVPSKKFLIVIGVMFLYIVVPLPSYISGMVLGSFIASLGWISYIFLTKPTMPKDSPKIIPVKNLQPMTGPNLKDVSLADGVTVHKGWMNEISEYNPDNYHINNTHSVHVTLDGVTLRLRFPKNNIAKRAMWDEEPPKTVEYIHQRIFNLEGSRVFLMPPGLVKKRVWSKKYPICIALKKPGSKVNESLPESDQGFEIISEDKCGPSILYLFARTCHEKEEWFKKIDAACKGTPLKLHLEVIKQYFLQKGSSKTQNVSTSVTETQQKRQSSEGMPQHKRQGSTDSISSTGSSSPMNEQGETESVPFSMEEFVSYMGRCMPREYYSDFIINKKSVGNIIDCEAQLLWVNAMISRCSWDFLHQKYWADKVMDKLQKKLDKIHIPYFIEAFKITDINLGSEMPVIRRAGKPFLDNQGFWVDLDINYGETKKSHSKSAVTDEEEEDSAESSTDEEEEVVPQGSEESGASSGGKRRFMRYLKKITESKYFQSATEMKYVKKAMEEVSNTPLVLTVELRFLSGVLAINIPPPPTDRVWYGFRGNPKLTLVAKPKVGERRVTVSHITEFIEKKLSVEFQRVLVMPNLDDLVMPLLFPEYDTDTVPVVPKPPSTASLSSQSSSPV
ncbi:unnamed protein product [Mytilus coruscus]|uniref:Testis-expressed sequence 2 protein n=1 Tax=Mytilus coruscus TaxID=42192 RepID=A0A6J8B1D6_MYTCO|nr:unnamed protein product [Mytilus coruscus]